MHIFSSQTIRYFLFSTNHKFVMYFLNKVICHVVGSKIIFIIIIIIYDVTVTHI